MWEVGISRLITEAENVWELSPGYIYLRDVELLPASDGVAT